MAAFALHELVGKLVRRRTQPTTAALPAHRSVGLQLRIEAKIPKRTASLEAAVLRHPPARIVTVSSSGLTVRPSRRRYRIRWTDPRSFSHSAASSFSSS